MSDRIYGTPASVQTDIWFAQLLDTENSIYRAVVYIDTRRWIDLALIEIVGCRGVDGIPLFLARLEANAESIWQWVEHVEDWPFLVVELTGAEDPRTLVQEWTENDLNRAVEVGLIPMFSCDRRLVDCGDPDGLLTTLNERHIATVLNAYARNLAPRSSGTVDCFDSGLLNFHAMHEKPTDAPNGDTWGISGQRAYRNSRDSMHAWTYGAASTIGWHRPSPGRVSRRHYYHPGKYDEQSIR